VRRLSINAKGVTAIVAATLLIGCEQKRNAQPVYEHVVRAALPHDMKPSDSVACIGAHDKNGELYDLGCNALMEQEPMVGMYKARFSEDPAARQPNVSGNVMGSAWRCHFDQGDVVLICERVKSN